jgi:hypothetical protein
VGERLKPPVLKTGVHFVDREFESRPLRQSNPFSSLNHSFLAELSVAVGR